MSKSLNLIDEARAAVAELSGVRKDFGSGKVGSDQAGVWVGLFNSTARIINTAINAEKWLVQQEKNTPKKQS